MMAYVKLNIQSCLKSKQAETGRSGLLVHKRWDSFQMLTELEEIEGRIMNSS